MLEGGEVDILECRQELVAEGEVNVTKILVLRTLIRVISDDIFLVKGRCPHQNSGRSTGVGWADKRELADERVLCYHQDDPKVAFLAPSAGTLDRCHVRSEETMRVLDGHLVQFTQILGEGWGREAVNDGID